TAESAPAMKHSPVVDDEEIAGLQTEADAHRGIVQEVAELAIGRVEIRNRLGIEVDGTDRAAVVADRAQTALGIELDERCGVTQVDSTRLDIAERHHRSGEELEGLGRFPAQPLGRGRSVDADALAAVTGRLETMQELQLRHRI